MILRAVGPTAAVLAAVAFLPAPAASADPCVTIPVRPLGPNPMPTVIRTCPGYPTFPGPIYPTTPGPTVPGPIYPTRLLPTHYISIDPPYPPPVTMRAEM